MPSIPPSGRPTTQPSNLTTDPSAPTSPEKMAAMWDAFKTDGFDDRELNTLIRGAVSTGNVEKYAAALRSAVVTPTMPQEDHADPKFLEVLAWYIDKSSPGGGRGDGQLQLGEVKAALQQYSNRYLSLSIDPNQATARMQTWKFIQKLRIVESAIEGRERAGLGAHFPYDAHAMMTVNSSEFNTTNTMDSRAEFNERVIAGSFDKPVLVKFGLTYCAHCLLLEQLGAVPAVAEKYGDAMDVFKLWWNPNDTAMADISAVAAEQGVTSSPVFILYKDGEIVKSGYGFPDENGDGLEGFLKGHIEEPTSDS
jgi:thiol-disulfide isomerase/thioredoxin